MNLSKREQLLAAGVGLIFFLFLGNYIWESIRSGIDTKENLKLNLSKQRDEQKLQLTAGAIAKSKLNRLVSQSLPSNEEKARAQYLEWLINLADQCNLSDPLPKSTGDTIEKDLYQSFRFQLAGTGTIENATKLLHAFHTKDYLHRITRFDMQPIPNNNPPNRLRISLDCEVLALKNANPVQPAPGDNAPRIERPLAEYENSIVGRNIFAPTNTPPVLEQSKLVSATLGLKMDVGVAAKESDPGQVLKYELWQFELDGDRSGRLQGRDTCDGFGDPCEIQRAMDLDQSPGRSPAGEKAQGVRRRFPSVCQRFVSRWQRPPSLDSFQNGEQNVLCPRRRATQARRYRGQGHLDWIEFYRS
ncbi:MAG: hypothetical protein NT168_16965 [Planctomycetota bacterium]|nr:hypothetical protein [Planctomycetota bacterium]